MTEPLSLSWLEVCSIAGLAGLTFILGRRLGRYAVAPAGEACEILKRLETLERARASAELANQELRRALEEFERLAGTDRLTGAWNRRRLEEGALALMSLAVRKRDPLVVLFFDLDHFKQVNDQHGHNAGDRVLVEVVRIARTSLRTSDFLARWGGEEFVVIAPGTALPGAMLLAEKLRSAIAAIDHPGVGIVTISVGVAEFHVGETLEDWIKRADLALYRAKALGRNQVISAPMPEGLPTPPPQPLFHLVWDPSYACGHDHIDTQHQQLFELANAVLAQGQAENQPHVEGVQLLLAHVAQHFHDEEIILAKAAYSDLPRHAREHQRLLTQARALMDAPAEQDFMRLALFLALDLIKGHILKEDRHYISVIGRTPESQDSGGR